MKFDGAKLLKKAAEAVDIPEDAVLDLPRVSLTGADRAFVENHKGLLGYGGEELLINGGSVIIKLRGRGLSLKGMTERELEVGGCINSVELLSWESVTQ